LGGVNGAGLGFQRSITRPIPKSPPFLPLIIKNGLLAANLYLPGNGDYIISVSQLRGVIHYAGLGSCRNVARTIDRLQTLEEEAICIFIFCGERPAGKFDQSGNTSDGIP